MSDRLGYDANLRRGQMLRESGRYADACTFLGEAIQADPEQPQPYLELALVKAEFPTGREESLRAIDRAVALAPNSAHFLGYKAYLLSQFGRHQEALDVRARAFQLDPWCRIALLAETNAYTKLNRWTEAEASARRMLELNAEDTAGLNLLAQAFRFQKRYRESREIVAKILARVPDDAFGHANAGYEALQTNDFRRANHHFLQALRADPHYDFARRGLLQSLRTRVWIYRVNMRILLWVGGTKNGTERWVPLLIFLSFGLLLGPVLLYIVLALTLQPISNFFLLFEPTGRRALNAKEWRRALFTGFMCALVLILLAVMGLFGIFIVVAGYLSLFAFGVYLPQWIDAWRARREERLAETDLSATRSS